MAKSFLSHAKVMAALIFLSRLLGLAREAAAAWAFGAGAVWSAFTFAFTLPNLFRKLLGEGALSAAFIPLYSRNRDPAFAAATVRALVVILVVITVIGELVLLACLLKLRRPDYVLAVRLGMVMLPYVVFVCGGALLAGILQVHGRFAVTAATAAALNLVLLGAMVAAYGAFDLTSEAGRTAGVFLLSAAVLVAGAVQVAMLLPGLRAAGVPLRSLLIGRDTFGPGVKRVLRLSVPVAIGAGVMQVGVLLDKGISFVLARGTEVETLMGLALPLAEGAAARLSWAQFLYQFPLGVFAVALGTAIFPKLAADADDPAALGQTLRQGAEAALAIGIPASCGLMLTATPAVELLFERGQFTPADTVLVARSTVFYAGGIWAYSLLQIVARAYYARGDTLTPTLWAGANLVANLAIELPLLWTPLAESGMAVATAATFGVQAVVMLLVLARSIDADLRPLLDQAWRMLLAAGVMSAALLVTTPLLGDQHSAIRLTVLTVLGVAVYGGAALLLRVEVAGALIGRRRDSRVTA